MPEAIIKILKFNHEQKSLRTPFVMYADTDFPLEKISTCDNNPKESYTTKLNKHTPCGYSLFTTIHLTATKTNMVSTEVKTL